MPIGLDPDKKIEVAEDELAELKDKKFQLEQLGDLVKNMVYGLGAVQAGSTRDEFRFEESSPLVPPLHTKTPRNIHTHQHLFEVILKVGFMMGQKFDSFEDIPFN